MTHLNYLKMISTIMLIIFFVFQVSSQNLVPNGSFEDTIPCITGNPNQLPCLPWYSPTGGSPDYFSSIWSPGCNSSIGAPSNSFGYQFARTGVAYCGLGTYESQSPNAREYIQCPITTPLISGNKYYASFYVSLGDNEHFACDRIGAYFSLNAVTAAPYHVLNYIPQVENDSGNIITDTMNWTLIAGYFYATGGEQYITIGNFRKDNKTLIDSFAYAFDPFAYYYIDDVSVIDCTATGINENKHIKFHLLENPVGDALQFTSVTQLTRVFIYDMVGNKLKEFVLNQNNSTYTVNVTDLKDGMYFLMAEDRNKRRGVRKFVKQ